MLTLLHQMLAKNDISTIVTLVKEKNKWFSDVFSLYEKTKLKSGLAFAS